MDQAAISKLVDSLEDQIQALKAMLGGEHAMSNEGDAEEESETSPPPHENPRARRVRQREKASRLIRGEMAKGKETDYALD